MVTEFKEERRLHMAARNPALGSLTASPEAWKFAGTQFLQRPEYASISPIINKRGRTMILKNPLIRFSLTTVDPKQVVLKPCIRSPRLASVRFHLLLPL